MTEALVRVSSIPREIPLVRPSYQRLRIEIEPLAPVFNQRGYYGPTGTLMPTRYRFLHPDAAASLVRLEQDYPEVFFWTDVFRNATGSKKRREKNRRRRVSQGKSAIYTGKLPGSSAHNFGLAADLDVKRSLRNLQRFREDFEIYKEELDETLRSFGWWCHRDGPAGGDHGLGSESWHYNYFGDDPDRWLSHSYRTTSGGVEAKIQYMYGPLTLSEDALAKSLHRLGYFEPGPRNWDPRWLKESVTEFQRDWTLTHDGIAGPQTQRALLYVDAEFHDGVETLVVPGP